MALQLALGRLLPTTTSRSAAAALCAGSFRLLSSAPRVAASQPAGSLYEGRNGNELFNPTPEHAELRKMCADFALAEIEPQARAHDKSGTLNKPLLQKVGELGLLGITIPEEDGGAGMDTTAAVIVHHEFSKYDPGFCLAYLAHSMLFVNNFYQASSKAQKDRYLAKVLSGEWVGAMGMTEPGAGTDVLGMTTSAEKQDNGDYIINGSKTYITNGDTADVLMVYAKVNGKISTFIIERGYAGFSSSNPIDKCGMRGSTMAELSFDNCRVPGENLVGKEGDGIKHMMRNLEIERVVLAAMSVGIAERCFEVMLDFAHNRKAFGNSLTHFGQIQKHIGDSYAWMEAAKALTYNVARDCAPNTENRIGTDAAKLFASKVGKDVADAAIQVLGGAGYCKEYPVEKLWRDAKLLEIGGGTSEAHEKNMTKDLVRKLM